MRTSVIPVLAAALAWGLSGCSDAPATPAAPGATISVVTSFYPAQLLVEEIGGDRVESVTLAKPGAEPHDLELTPRAIGQVQGADLVVYLAGFQPAVDDAVRQAPRALDLADSTSLVAAEEDESGHAEESHEDEHGATDPHFWLDPQRYSAAARAVTQQIVAADPEHAQEYEARLADLTKRLAELDGEMAAGLATCRSRDIVTAHAAFTYLAQRYDLRQVGIAGLSAESEVSPARMGEITRLVRERGVTTIYTETLLPPDVAQAVARETGAQTAVLDPVEALTDQSAGDNYFEVMRTNLAALRAGQGCS